MNLHFAKIMAALLIVIVMACTSRFDDENSTNVTNQNEVEPNESQANAQILKHNAAVKGYIQEPQDQDWYQLVIPPDSILILNALLTGVPDLNLKFELFDQAGDRLIEVDKNKENEDEILPNYGLAGGNYYLRVRELWVTNKPRKSNDSAHYVLKINLTPAYESVEFEPNNRGIQATAIIDGVDMEGFISPYNDEDWYKFNLPGDSAGYLVISLSGVENVDTKILVYDPIEALIQEKNNEIRGMPEKIPNLGIELSKEFYYIVVKGGAWQTNEKTPYRLRIDIIDTDGMVEIEPNDRFVRATTLVEDDTIRGFIETEKDIDWFKIKNIDSTKYLIWLEAQGVPKVDLVISVYNQEEQELFKVNETGEMEAEIIPNLGILPDQTCYFKVQNALKRGNSDQFYKIYTRLYRYYNEEESENNNSREMATPLLPNTQISGYLHPAGDVDYYQLDLTNENRQVRLDIKLQGVLKVNTNLFLYDKNLYELASGAERPAEETEKIGLIVHPGIYYVKITGESNQSNYRDKYKLLASVRPIR